MNIYWLNYKKGYHGLFVTKKTVNLVHLVVNVLRFQSKKVWTCTNGAKSDTFCGFDPYQT